MTQKTHRPLSTGQLYMKVFIYSFIYFLHCFYQERGSLGSWSSAQLSFDKAHTGLIHSPSACRERTIHSHTRSHLWTTKNNEKQHKQNQITSHLCALIHTDLVWFLLGMVRENGLSDIWLGDLITLSSILLGFNKNQINHQLLVGNFGLNRKKSVPVKSFHWMLFVI